MTATATGDSPRPGCSTGSATTGSAATGEAPPGDLRTALAFRLLTLAPHTAIEVRAAGTDRAGTLTWVDGRGLPLRTLARQVLAAGRAACATAGLCADALRVGVAAVPLVAEIAARWGAVGGDNPTAGDAAADNSAADTRAPLTAVAPGHEAAFLVPHPLAVLVADDASPAERHAAAALVDAGVLTCGALAALTPDALETRLGAAGVALWHRARGADRRVVFRHAARERPSASTAWTEFELREPDPLLFAANGLIEQVCTALRARGEAARTLVLTCALAGGGALPVRVQGARDAADAATWRRLVRAALERVTLADGVVGLALTVEAAREAHAPQADLFDRGAATAAAAARATARLVEDALGVVVQPARTGHALPEHRLAWAPVDADAVARPRPVEPRVAARAAAPAPPPAPPSRPALVRDLPALQVARGKWVPNVAPHTGPDEPPNAVPETPADTVLEAALTVLDAPRPLVVTTRSVRGHHAPTHFRERLAEGARGPRGGQPLVAVAHAGGPDQIVGVDPDHGPIAREYWQCLTAAGEIMLLFRDLAAPATDVDGVWYLHGWWE